MSPSTNIAPPRALPVKISKHFTLKEMTVTQTQLPNTVSNPVIIGRMRLVCDNILEKVREHFRRSVVVHSGYRSPAVNKAVGGSKTSQHVMGEAADFHVSGHSLYEIAEWISNNLDFDQLILENYISDKSSSGWVHCSYGPRMRYDILTKFKGSSVYHQGLLKA